MTKVRSLSRRVYVTPLCKLPRSIKMWAKPERNSEMVVEKETLEINYDCITSFIYESNGFLHKSSYHRFFPPKRGLNILKKLLPDLIQVNLSSTGMDCLVDCALSSRSICRLKKLYSWETCYF